MRHRDDALCASDLMQVHDYEPAPVHYVRYDEPTAGSRSQRTVCGDVIGLGEDGGSDDVTCPDCRKWIAEYDALEF